jgi:hypothetical protein
VGPRLDGGPTGHLHVVPHAAGYLSTEVAGGFTGRVLGVYATGCQPVAQSDPFRVNVVGGASLAVQLPRKPKEVLAPGAIVRL